MTKIKKLFLTLGTALILIGAFFLYQETWCPTRHWQYALFLGTRAGVINGDLIKLQCLADKICVCVGMGKYKEPPNDVSKTHVIIQGRENINAPEDFK